MKKSPSANKSVDLQANRRHLVMRIYLYVFMGIGLVLTSVGVFGLGQNIYKAKLFPKYPLEQYEESRCQYFEGYPESVAKTDLEVTKLVYERNKQQAEECRISLEAERQVRKISDFYNSLILFVIGTLLFSGHLLVNWRTNNK